MSQLDDKLNSVMILNRKIKPGKGEGQKTLRTPYSCTRYTAITQKYKLGISSNILMYISLCPPEWYKWPILAPWLIDYFHSFRGKFQSGRYEDQTWCMDFGWRILQAYIIVLRQLDKCLDCGNVSGWMTKGRTTLIRRDPEKVAVMGNYLTSSANS